MAEGRRYVCHSCARVIEAWDDGNPYYFDEAGAKQCAYHPSAERSLCVGNDVPHLCLKCGHEFNVDSNAPRSDCEKCGSSKIVDTFALDGRTCPTCGGGQFHRDPEVRAIS
jgi:DNA-directed RNA polymerase subunit RPC12/RpoP